MEAMYDRMVAAPASDQNDDDTLNAYELATAHPPGMYELATAHPPGMYELDSEQHGGETDDSIGLHLHHTDEEEVDGQAKYPEGYLEIDEEQNGATDDTRVLVMKSNDDDEGDA
jgi:hypothetical protein